MYADRCHIDSPDPDLLHRAIRGQEDAFTMLYRRRQGGVYRFALQMTGSVAAAEDVTQETFIALLKLGERFDSERGTVASFLYGIARNVVMRRLERDSRNAWSDDGNDVAADGDVLEDLTRRETIEQVRRAVLSLPPVYREVVVLCDLQDTSYEDAATALECAVGTIRSRLNRGRGMLARKLGGVSNVVRSCE
jgi:RNA polymerase sigma-70 factor (ECF subfamily)